jgi:hypothetical protein
VNGHTVCTGMALGCFETEMAGKRLRVGSNLIPHVAIPFFWKVLTVAIPFFGKCSMSQSRFVLSREKSEPGLNRKRNQKTFLESVHNFLSTKTMMENLNLFAVDIMVKCKL